MNDNSRNIILWLVCLVAGMQLHAQSVFNVLDSISYGSGKLLSSDTAFYTTGSGYNVSGSGTIILTKYSLIGDIIDVDTFSADGIASYDAVLNNFNGKLILPHTINTVYPYNGGTADMELSIMNENFAPFITQTFGGSNQEITVDFVASDTAFYILGCTNSFGAGNGDYYLVITDTVGNLISEHTYGESTLDFARSISLTNLMEMEI